MTHNIACFRCGASLAALSLPFSRQDACPSCHVHLHVCRMCLYFDPNVPRQCTEDDAEDVTEKERLNFCDYYKPSDSAFDGAHKREADAAQAQLEALFGDGDAPEPTADTSAAEDLFK